MTPLINIFQDNNSELSTTKKLATMLPGIDEAMNLSKVIELAFFIAAPLHIAACPDVSSPKPSRNPELLMCDIRYGAYGSHT